MTTYDTILHDAQEDPNILGLILSGSRGKGFDNEHSDYDVTLVAKDEAVSLLKEKYANTENMDLTIYSLSDLKAYACWEGDGHWDRYDFAHVHIPIDKTGELATVATEKGYLPTDKREQITSNFIDAYVNGVFRSVKCVRNKNVFGAHIEAANSMLDLLHVVFALENRHRPFLGYTQEELEKYPLEHLPWPAAEFIEKVRFVLQTADLRTQQELLRGIEKVARGLGYNEVFDAWEGKDAWAMSYRTM